ncbi:collagen alpha-3(VI) chain-like [Callorhinchus milii]|uniref:collagen alpha-3(VI) chain-like n=1 Tax=Callorhinchus milii TaxID=7868 RepID=UPI001C3F7685|nr:collagen alpha-3(VI) chain-like [Callorhinchus milii]
MLVLLTSGKSRDDVKQAGEALKRAAIVTFVIGGMEADGHELQEIAYSPNLMFAVEDFQSLPDIKNQLLRPLKTLTVEIVKLPTTVTEVGINEADNSELHQIAYSPKLIFQVNDYWDLSDLDLQLLTVPNPQMGESVEIPSATTEVDKRDIVFLIDGSANIGKGFPIVREFLSRMIGNFDAGEEKVRFGVTQFSENPRTEFF